MRRLAALLAALLMVGGCAGETGTPRPAEAPAPITAPGAPEATHPVPDVLWPLPGGNRWPKERWSSDWYTFTGEKLVVLRADGSALEAVNRDLAVLWSAPLPAKATRVHYDSRGRRAVVVMDGARAVMADLLTGALLGDAPLLGSEGIWRENWVLDRRPVDDAPGTFRWTLYRLEPDGGWSKAGEYSGGMLAELSEDGRTLLIATDRHLWDANIYRDGELIHTFSPRGGRYHLTASGNQVYHEDFRGTVTVYDLAGKELWSRRAEVSGEAYAREWPDHDGRPRFVVAPRRGPFTVFDEHGEFLFRAGLGVPDTRFPDWLLARTAPSAAELIGRTGRTVWQFDSPQVSFTPDGQWLYDYEPFETIRAYRVPAVPE